MKIWDKVTGSDLTRDWQAFEDRAAQLPDDYRPAWEQIKTQLFAYGDFTGRNLTAIVDGILGLPEPQPPTDGAPRRRWATTSPASARQWPADTARRTTGTGGASN